MIKAEGTGSIQWTNPKTDKKEYLDSLDLAYMPKDYTVETLIKYLTENNIILINSFKKI